MERSVAWYRDVLGLEPVRLDEWRRGQVPFVSMRVTADTIIDLQIGDVTGVNMDHLALVLDDVAPTASRRWQHRVASATSARHASSSVRTARVTGSTCGTPMAMGSSCACTRRSAPGAGIITGHPAAPAAPYGGTHERATSKRHPPHPRRF